MRGITTFLLGLGILFVVGTVPSQPRAQTNPVKITAPADGTVVAPGDNVIVTVIGNDLGTVLLVTSNIVDTVTEPPFTFVLMIPLEAVGPMPVIALGKDRSNNLHTDQIAITVRPTANLDSLDVGSSMVRFSGLSGLQRQLTVKGIYSDGVKRDVTNGETGTSYLSNDPNVVTVDEDGLLQVQANGEAIITVSNAANPRASALVNVVVHSPKLLFENFDIETAKVALNHGNSSFEVEGTFVLSAISNGLDLFNEDVTVRIGLLDPFVIPAGAFLQERRGHDKEFEFAGPAGGITKMKIEVKNEEKSKQGRKGRRRVKGRPRGKMNAENNQLVKFKVEARGVDLNDLDLNNLVNFSLQIGFDYSERRIQFDDRGSFRRGNKNQ